MQDYVRGDKKERGNQRSGKSVAKPTVKLGNKSQPKGESNKFIKLASIAMGGFLLLFLLFRSVNWSQIFPLNETQTILFATKNVDQEGMLLARFYADEAKIEVITMDPDTEIEVVGGYGSYRAQAMYPLLALEGKSDQFIRASLGLTLGMILDRTVVVSEGDIEISESPIAFRNLFWQSIKDFSNSLSIKERIQLASLLLDTKTMIDVYEQSSPDFKLLEKDFSRSYLTGNTGPGCSVALINTTEASGLARKLDSLLASDKLYVVRTINEDEVLDKTSVLISKEQKNNVHCKLALSKLSKIVPGGFDKKTTAEENLSQYRADVVVKIGKDLAR